MPWAEYMQNCTPASCQQGAGVTASVINVQISELYRPLMPNVQAGGFELLLSENYMVVVKL
jgi:hypothetical protein